MEPAKGETYEEFKRNVVTIATESTDRLSNSRLLRLVSEMEERYLHPQGLMLEVSERYKIARDATRAALEKR